MSRNGARHRAGSDWFFTWPLTIVFAAMVFLTVEEMHRPRVDPAHPRPGAGWEERLPDRIERLTEALGSSGLPLSLAAEEPRGSGTLRWVYRRFEVRLPPAEEGRVRALLDYVRELDDGVTADSVEKFDGTEFRIGLDGLLTHSLRVHWGEIERRPRVALAIGALGEDLRVARECVALQAPLALVVQPFLPFSREVAQLGHLFEREVLLGLRLPLRPRSDSGDVPIGEEIGAALASVPYAVGATAIPDGAEPGPEEIERVRDALREKNLFLVTTGSSPAAAGNVAVVVLDGEGTMSLSDQVERLIAAARSTGAAIGFTRSNEPTLTALAAALGQIAASSVDIVPVSTLAQPVALSAR
jgi:polysaccharide deacetylase 2 family uncharacterized protein YibQ